MTRTVDRQSVNRRRDTMHSGHRVLLKTVKPMFRFASGGRTCAKLDQQRLLRDEVEETDVPLLRGNNPVGSGGKRFHPAKWHIYWNMQINDGQDKKI